MIFRISESNIRFRIRSMNLTFLYIRYSRVFENQILRTSKFRLYSEHTLLCFCESIGDTMGKTIAAIAEIPGLVDQFVTQIARAPTHFEVPTTVPFVKSIVKFSFRTFGFVVEDQKTAPGKLGKVAVGMTGATAIE